jgi:hypothetical protein
MSLRVIITAALAALLCGTAGGARLSQPLDVELAIDTTGSMGPSIKRMQRDAAKLVTDLRTRFPAARFALVQFKDAADTPEYEVLQSMTSDPKLVAQATARMGPGGGGDNPEAYNVVFRNSYADESIGWRADSRKLVVVVGDAEPHGAGSAGLAGCLDASADPHALRVRQELVGMKVNGRTLIMIRQASTASAALDCFEALAEQTFQGGTARDAGSNLTGVIEALVGRAAKLAGIKPSATPARGSTGHPRPSGGGADRTPPRVSALKSGGTRGTNIRLVYRVTDNSGRSSDRIVVYAGGRVLTQSGWAPFGPANGKAYFFDFPSSASMSGTYSFCVTSKDPSGNVSRPSCAPLIIM